MDVRRVRNPANVHQHGIAEKDLDLASLTKWLSIRLRTKWLWVRVPLPSLKLQIWRLLRARSSLTFKQTIECRFTLKLTHDMIITYSQDLSY